MDLSFECPGCRSKLKVDTIAFPAGARVPCPHCNSDVVVPKAVVGPGVTIGGFKLDKLLGKGGMGEVYLATQLSMQRDVALKILPANFALQSESVDRFLQEVKMAARLKHPNIVRAYEAGEDNGVYFLAMDYVEGTSIDDRLRKDGALPEAEVRVIAEKLGRALDQIWEKHKMIHRDIKPANIMLDEYGEPLLMDMGLSKALDDGDGLTLSTAIMGSPNYMSPEQGEGASGLDFRTDMYSLGATFYHMLTGKVPFKGKSVMEVLRKQATENLPDPREHNPDISEGMVRIIERMMAKQADARYPNWQDFLKDLESLVFGAGPAESGLNPGDSVIIRSADVREAVEPEASEEVDGPEMEELPVQPESSGDPHSKKKLYIGISSVIGVVILVGIFMATRPGGEGLSPIAPGPTLPSTAGQKGGPVSALSPTDILTSSDWVWTEPVNLSHLNSSESDSFPFLSGDGLTLFFSSKRKSGKGNADIWKSTRDSVEGEFGTPILIEGDINTEHAEISPWISSDGRTLLFASDRPGGEGAMDIWRSTRSSPGSSWGSPSLDKTLSTRFSDMRPSLSPDGREILIEQSSDDFHLQVMLGRRSGGNNAFSAWMNPGPDVNSVEREGGPEFVSDARAFVYHAGPKRGSDDLFISLRSADGRSYGAGIDLGLPLNGPKTEAHPTLSADGKIIVFTSNRDGGLGMLDLWMSRRVPRNNNADSSSAPAREIDLIGLLDPRRDFVDPEFRIEDGKLLSPPFNTKMGYSLVMIPFKPVPAEYDIHLQLERKGDAGLSVNFGFVMGGRQGTFVVDGAREAVTGVANIDGASIRDRANSTRTLGRRLLDGQLARMSVRVRTDRIVAEFNGEKVVDWKGRPEQLSVWDRLELKDRGSLFLFTQAEFVIHKMTLSSPNADSTTRKAAALPAHLDRGLVGHWNFDGESRMRLADVSGSGLVDRDTRPGSGSTWTNDVPPVPGGGPRALYLPGVNLGATISLVSEIDFANGMTVSAWVKSLRTGPRRQILESTGAGFRFMTDGSFMLGLPPNATTLSRPKSVELPLREWHHVAVTFDGDVLRNYANGGLGERLKIDQPSSLVVSGLYLGRLGGKGALDSHILLDDVRLYNRALGADEINTLAGK